MPRYMMNKEGKVVELPDVEEPEPVEVDPQPSLQARIEEATSVPEEPKDDLSDLFTVPQPEDNDMVTDHLFEIDSPDQEDDLSDLTDVGDGFGGEPASEEPQKPRYRIAPKSRRFIRREPPPTSLGGLR